MKYINEITHLTYTGYYAGLPLCDTDKEQSRLRGELFIHAMYAPLDNPDINFCPECLRVWNEADNE